MRGTINRLTALAAAAALILGTVFPAVPAAAQEKQIDYHARMGIQTSNTLWIMQMNYYKGKSNETLGTELENKLFCADQENPDKLVAKEGTFDEVEITGDGVYTVNLDGANFEGETDISQLHVATDIPLDMPVKFTDVKAKVDGRVVAAYDQAVMESESPYLEGGMVVLVMNHWRDSVVGYLNDHGCSETGGSGWRLLTGQGGENISITFKVSGFGVVNPDAVEATPTPQSTIAPDSQKGKKDSSGSLPLGGIALGAVCLVVIAGIVVFVGVSRKKK